MYPQELGPNAVIVSGIDGPFYLRGVRRPALAGRRSFCDCGYRVSSLTPMAMQRGLVASFCALLIFIGGCAFHNQGRTQKREHENAARSAALRWLVLLDQGDYEEAFEWEAQDFRMARTQTQFVRYMQARRAPFGQALGRKFIGAANIHKFVGVPEGNYISVLFKTEFEKKAETAERVILVEQPVGWRVLEYRIY